MEEQVFHLFHCKDNPVRLTSLFSLKICGCMDLYAVLPTILQPHNHTPNPISGHADVFGEFLKKQAHFHCLHASSPYCGCGDLTVAFFSCALPTCVYQQLFHTPRSSYGDEAPVEDFPDDFHRIKKSSLHHLQWLQINEEHINYVWWSYPGPPTVPGLVFLLWMLQTS